MTKSIQETVTKGRALLDRLAIEDQLREIRLELMRERTEKALAVLRKAGYLR